jgi:hypothetical protein
MDNATISHQTVRLDMGSHRGPDKGVCVMELASMLAGEPFSDRPQAVSHVLGSLLQGYNDGLDDGRRQSLKRFAADAVGTAADPVSERDRRRMAAAGLGEAPAARLFCRLAPYFFARARGRRVAIGEDDGLHADICARLDALIAAGADPPHAPAAGAHTRRGPVHAPLPPPDSGRTLRP